MKKILVFMMALAMTLNLAACSGDTVTSAVPSSAPAVSSSSAPAQVDETEFTEEQQTLAKDFMSMAEEFDAIADKVNASPELLENEELVTSMNELADSIIEADEYFTSPETLTPEAMGALRVAIDVGRSFIAEASTALDEIAK